MNAITYKRFYLYFVLFIFNVMILVAETSAHENMAQNHKQDDSTTTSEYAMERILDVYQIGVIKGDKIPDKSAFGKFAESWGLQYKKDSLYAILSVTNIHNGLVSISFNNPPYKHYYGDLCQLMELAPGETICFFIEIDNNSPIANLLTYHGNMTIPLDVNASLVDWDTVLSPSSENVTLTIKHDITYMEPPSDSLILQISLFSRCQFPLYFPAPDTNNFPPLGTTKDNVYNITIITGEENAISRNMFSMVDFNLRSIEDGFLLLPGEHIISRNAFIYENKNDGFIYGVLKSTILNKRIRATWINGIYSKPLFIH